jgi:hypothetical protein
MRSSPDWSSNQIADQPKILRFPLGLVAAVTSIGSPLVCFSAMENDEIGSVQVIIKLECTEKSEFVRISYT